jgi:outer membrane lipoprotein-sorting protein
MSLKKDVRDGKTVWMTSDETNDRIDIVTPDGTSHGVVKLKDVTKTNFLRICDWK